MDPSALDLGSFQRRLMAERDQWVKRMSAISGDRRRETQPLVQDSQDQATQRENDETLDALDAAGRRELDAIDRALGRIEAGSYGRCARCEEAIEVARLEALPTAITCATCARQAEA